MADIYLICDMSGSMVEDGRRFIVRNIVRTVDQYYRLRNEVLGLFLAHWSSSVAIERWTPGQDFPEHMLACEGVASGDSLVEALSGAKEGYFMLLTDGYWTRETRRRIQSWYRSLPDGHFRIIKVGVDADPRLKGESVFSSEDLLSALEGWVR
jgi:hypothetical protein